MSPTSGSFRPHVEVDLLLKRVDLFPDLKKKQKQKKQEEEEQPAAEEEEELERRKVRG